MTELGQRVRAPRLRTVLLVVHLLILCLPLVGIFYFRLYESQLVRQTESELIVQGAALAAAQRAALLFAAESRQIEMNGYGRAPSGSTGSAAAKESDDFDPAIPGLDLARHPVLPQDLPGRQPALPPDPLAAAAGTSLAGQLEELQHVSLAGIRILDSNGVVVATTGAEAGLSLAHRPEVAAALAGRKTSVLRHRSVSNPNAALNDIQRTTPWRVVVAFPIESDPVEGGERIWGAVLLARTPMSAAQALWRDRGHLLAAGLLILAVVSLVTLWSAAKVGRPVRALIDQAERVARGERDAVTPLENPGTREIARISEAVAEMAGALGERADYISTFAANVSHEFKTPLTSIRGAVELLEEHQDEMSAEERERFLSMLARDARRLERLVERLLELARADVHRLGDETAGVARILERLGKRFESVHFDDRGADQLSVRMASETLESVLGNLLDNAVRHAESRIELRAGSNTDGTVCFEVEDDGPGISDANLPRVFDRFFTTRRDDGGSGLGLAIVKALVVAHGGEVGVSSERRRTVFQISLPSS
ncbi:MAG: HAMP domain-containing histidine kinase [Thermoanaerobaculia bacterium]|nr:HAMP domain-containing histidine kinase [Thermoanaerobaculia bacterium]